MKQCADPFVQWILSSFHLALPPSSLEEDQGATLEMRHRCIMLRSTFLWIFLDLYEIGPAKSRPIVSNARPPAVRNSSKGACFGGGRGFTLYLIQVLHFCSSIDLTNDLSCSIHHFCRIFAIVGTTSPWRGHSCAFDTTSLEKWWFLER